MTANEESWDLDSDEIRSIDSDELRETRPNRWKGSAATWRTLTEEERLLHRSMEQLRNRDLSVHLYNTFAVKNRKIQANSNSATDPDTEDADQALRDRADKTDWRPPNTWTAWPMNVKDVPGDDFMKETHDQDDDLTVRSGVPQLPSTVLEEELTATILKQAKERFRRRQDKHRQKEAAADETTAAHSQSAYSQSEFTTEDGDGSSAEEDPTKVAAATDDQTPKPTTKTYEAVVSANDDLSADLLRPSVRHILSMMDNTLTTLHNARLAGLSYMTDSSASATDVSDASEGSDAGSLTSRGSRTSRSSRGSPKKRSKQGRPRSKTPRTPEPEQGGKKRKGRPRKAHAPLPGETEKEMMIRIAREQHKRIPFSSEEDNNREDGNGEQGEVAEPADAASDDDEDAAEDTARDTSPEKSRSPRKKRDLPPEARLEARTRHRENMLRDWGLRDWSDIIGAASISGFKPEVVARAAQRCADLFGQGMEMQTLLEGPASKGPKPQRKRYLPNTRPRVASFSSSDEEGGPVPFRGVGKRQRSRGRDSAPPTDTEAQGAGSRASSRRRSASRSSSVGLFYCPVAGCERSLEGFDRKANLQRHVTRVHPGQAVEVDEVESENEMHGAVHVDGFLKPIRARKGWRAEDTGHRKRKRHYRGKRLQSGDETSGVGEESVWDSS
ncbi:putative RNA polymerase I specific transcription initiation factor [Colletotrichum karsti]|uniref:RNA polymerase I specific transcription initiation factor n=1 Tax=Colletotrichum karsti TaxID=1095194 RepID=A0A9P6HWJ1_9PEZI|nr:putative RNA polymerase I specific transcription initiation factor [Colletotrichum karsti]KAF9870251.1 putative RNA polymerase I specific transcription initiation factor [Colletotrichum karsti]